MRSRCSASVYVCVFALVALVGYAPPDSHKKTSQQSTARDCFSGKWGNDFVICGNLRSGKPGKGDAKKRGDEELTLQFLGNNKGEFNFYDCQNSRRALQSIPFTYELGADVIRFYWKGSEQEISQYRDIFHHRDTFRYDCRQDTLVFTDGLLNNTSYQGSNYFVRR